MLSPIKKNIWLVFFALTGLITCFLGGRFIYNYYNHYVMSGKASAHVLEWEIEEITKSKYAIAAVYEFEVNGEVHTGRTFFTKPYFPNYYSAEINLEKWQACSWDVWYHPKNMNKSTMQHLFPYKQGVHFLLSMCITGYFLWLNFYIRRVSVNYQ